MPYNGCLITKSVFSSVRTVCVLPVGPQWCVGYWHDSRVDWWRWRQQRCHVLLTAEVCRVAVWQRVATSSPLCPATCTASLRRRSSVYHALYSLPLTNWQWSLRDDVDLPVCQWCGLRDHGLGLETVLRSHMCGLGLGFEPYGLNSRTCDIRYTMH